MAKSKKASPKDIFLHILSIGTLYFSAGAFLTLVFTLINVGFPDPLETYYSPGSSLRWAISLLVVLFPVYIWSTRKLHKGMKDDPKKKDFKIRKWLINLTLFAAGAFILGDLIALINRFLGGELTVRFILKAMAILFVAGSIFGYYRYELKENIKKVSKASKSIAWGTSAIVLIAVFAGFWIAGSPFQQRLIRFDSQRINDLNNIQNQVLNYWQSKDTLPESLNQLEDDFSWFEVPVDPDTSEPYEYQVTGDLTFELCATFDTQSDGSPSNVRLEPYPGSSSERWTHDVGRECFERTIDPELYNGNTPRPAIR